MQAHHRSRGPGPYGTRQLRPALVPSARIPSLPPSVLFFSFCQYGVLAVPRADGQRVERTRQQGRPARRTGGRGRRNAREGTQQARSTGRQARLRGQDPQAKNKGGTWRSAACGNLRRRRSKASSFLNTEKREKGASWTEREKTRPAQRKQAANTTHAHT